MASVCGKEQKQLPMLNNFIYNLSAVYIHLYLNKVMEPSIFRMLFQLSTKGSCLKKPWQRFAPLQPPQPAGENPSRQLRDLHIFSSYGRSI